VNSIQDNIQSTNGKLEGMR